MSSQPDGQRPSLAPRDVVVWCLSDSRPGHRRQVEGLVSQLGRRCRIRTHWIDVASNLSRQLCSVLSGRFHAGEGLPDPHIIVGAGHDTHLPALAAKRARGGRSVVMMKPTLPTGLFDLCLVPEHDLLSFGGRLNRFRVVPTRGVLNPFSSSDAADPAVALMLVGGPSRHHGWSDDKMLQQLQEIRRLSPTTVRWALTTSRRTPPSFVRRLHSELCDDPLRSPVEIVPFEQTGGEWLFARLSQSKTVFVSEDSISMVYEALTVGADVGLLHVPRRRRSRNSVCIDRLLAEGLVIRFDDWCIDRFEKRQNVRFNEAARCADVVCERLLNAA